jgi:hypothetical protein
MLWEGCKWSVGPGTYLRWTATIAAAAAAAVVPPPPFSLSRRSSTWRRVKVSARIRLVVMCGLEEGLALWFADTFFIMTCLPRYRRACRSVIDTLSRHESDRHQYYVQTVGNNKRRGGDCAHWQRATLIPRHFASRSQVQGCGLGLDSVVLLLLLLLLHAAAVLPRLYSADAEC